MNINSLSARAPQAPQTDDARLRAAVRQLHGMLFNEVLKAARETVPEDGLMGGGMGDDVFRSMLDERYAQIIAEKLPSRMEETMVRQLSSAASLQRQNRDEQG